MSLENLFVSDAVILTGPAWLRLETSQPRGLLRVEGIAFDFSTIMAHAWAELQTVRIALDGLDMAWLFRTGEINASPAGRLIDRDFCWLAVCGLMSISICTGDCLLTACWTRLVWTWAETLLNRNLIGDLPEALSTDGCQTGCEHACAMGTGSDQTEAGFAQRTEMCNSLRRLGVRILRGPVVAVQAMCLQIARKIRQFLSSTE